MNPDENFECDTHCGLVSDYYEGFDKGFAEGEKFGMDNALYVDEDRLGVVLARLGPEKMPSTFRQLVIDVARTLGMTVDVEETNV